VSPLGETLPATTSVAIDPEHPWLGLFSYSEETLAYFHGREEETAELCRRVQRKSLTVLFGQSGLGKTSLLRAGVVPRLRKEGYCPVYVRVDYAPESPRPSEQIKQAIFRATAESGHWTRPGTAIEGESLWEFLHHRGDLLRDSARPPPARGTGRGRDRIDGDPTASDPALDALIRTQDRPAPAGTALEEDRMRNRAW